MEVTKETYPIHLKGELSIPPSRWIWLFKWLLAIPHYIVLAFLGIAFCVTWVITFFTVLFTGKYLKGLFDFNSGVLRWAWRVGFYSYQALGTDKYPPFGLEPDPTYPADLEIPYPEKLPNWMAFGWLLAIPHLIIVAVFQGGAGKRSGGGLVSILTIINAIVLLFTGKFLPSLFKFIIGLDRWSYRVFAYVSMMTDKYPPFRLDD